MNKLIVSFIIIFIMTIGCSVEINNPDPVYGYDTASYSFEIDGNNVNYIINHEPTTPRSISTTETVIAVGEIPGVGTVVETDANTYYLEVGDDFVQITLPTGTSTLHIYQFSKVATKIYYGVDNRLYYTTGTDADFSDDSTLVIDGNIFNSTKDVLATTLHYITNGTNIRYWPGNINDSEEIKEYDENGIATNNFAVRSKLKIIYIITEDDGTMWLIDDISQEISYVTLDIFSAYPKPLGYNVHTSTSQSWEFDGLYVNNRIDIDNTYFTADTLMGSKFGFSRDTMFHEFRDKRLYLGSSQRNYFGYDVDGTDLNVNVMYFNITSKKVESFGTFTIALEYERLIPNMWIDVNGDVYVIVDDTLYLYDVATSYTISTVYTHTNRLDAVTILPSGDIIVMDGTTGWWYNSDGSDYLDDNIIAQY